MFFFKIKAQGFIPLNEAEYLHKINHNIRFTSNDSLRLHNYLLLSEYWAPTDSLKSKQALNKVLESPRSKVFKNGVIDYYQGIFYSNQGSKKTALKHYENAINSFEKDPENIDFLIKSLYNSALLQIEDKGYDFMVKILTERCIPLSKKSKKRELLAYSYTQLGLAFMSVGQFDTAQNYHKMAEEVLKSIPNEGAIHLLTYLNMVSNYCYQPNSKMAKIYLDKAAHLIHRYPKSQYYPNYHYQESMYHTTKQDYYKALMSLEKGVKIAKEKNQAKLLHMLYFRKYNVYLMQEDYEKAKSQLEYILQENILNKEAFNRRITFTQLAAVNNVLGNHKEAYEWMKKSGSLGDSLQKAKLLEKMNELDVLHQTNEKQQKIDVLELEKKEHQLINESKNIRIKFLVLALLLSFIIVVLIYRTYVKQKQLNNQISLNHKQELAFIESRQKYEASKAILKGEEQERQRIAQDLHDSMGGMLANIRMSISQENLQNSQGLLQKIDKSIAEMRRISRNLMPETLKNLGLEVALKELCESMSQKGFHIQFEAFNLSKDIAFKIQFSLYRIVQESISNIIKYAQASNIIVQISQYENIIHLTVEDDRIGFDTTKVDYGLGIKNIKNRIALINGTVDIASEEGKGTTINVECHV